MAENAVVRARIDPALRDEAAAVLASMGLTVSDVVRLTLTRIARDKALPFEMRVPNRLTADTLAKSDRAEDVQRFDSAEAMFKELDI